ncbi:putative hydrolase or acyltransferase of alpha/beta superfamily [Flavobacterium limnosediminis JC2902]|uniref:Putative hydrolase or acyltransferase of alpha/beta superfamily n=1 Tax=Flavobacterium limnosediminis JC2902 TaxID=1341181 RepID=V6SIX0_9FLAO|nr:alpha/beta hydrolase [Flavobacterium limnosediminis]ESU26404.1 putative hydrolase or acyltransferase of alpha/beta superfamily [Flavobacterium limnosediminis JC2902]
MELINKIAYFTLTKSIGLYINLVSYIFPKKAARLAYKFFTQPREGKLLPNAIPDILKEAEQEVLFHEENSIQTYTWKGNETKILLVHGWESNASRWEQFINYFRKSKSTIIALDGPGQGLSSGVEFNIPQYAKHVNALVERFQPQFIIGHSMGGAACLYYQFKYNNPILEKMVILGAPSEFEILLNNYKRTISLNEKTFQLLTEKFTERFKISPSEFSGKKFASTFNLKGLIAHDIDDDVVAFNEGKEIAKAWKSAKFIETKGLGHSLHDENLYQKINNFLFEE